MERMSDKLKDVCSEFYLSTEERRSVTAAIDRLAHYEDLEERGRLVELPCNIGDEIWLNYEGKAHRMRVYGISISARGNDTILHFGGYPIATAWGSNLGKTIFLTRPEAEAALAASGKEG